MLKTTFLPHQAIAVRSTRSSRGSRTCSGKAEDTTTDGGQESVHGYSKCSVQMHNRAFYPLATLAAAVLCSGLGVQAADSFYGLSAVDIDGKNVSLSSLKGKVTVVVNVATY